MQSATLETLHHPALSIPIDLCHIGNMPPCYNHWPRTYREATIWHHNRCTKNNNSHRSCCCNNQIHPPSLEPTITAMHRHRLRQRRLKRLRHNSIRASISPMISSTISMGSWNVVTHRKRLHRHLLKLSPHPRKPLILRAYLQNRTLASTSVHCPMIVSACCRSCFSSPLPQCSVIRWSSWPS